MRALWLVLALAWPGAALAGPWEAFVARCLSPMEAVGAVVTEGLPFQDVTRGTTGIEIARFAGDGFVFEVVRDGAGAQTACGVRVTAGPAGEDFAAAFADWAARVAAAGQYIARDDTGPRLALRSDQTREPVLFVSLWYRPGPAPWSAIVQESDLES